MRPVASASFIRLLARPAGVSFETICAEAGLPSAALEGGAIPYADSVRLWDAFERVTGDPLVGHSIGASLSVLQTGVFGPVFAHAADLRSSLAALGAVLQAALPQGR